MKYVTLIWCDELFQLMWIGNNICYVKKKKLRSNGTDEGKKYTERRRTTNVGSTATHKQRCLSFVPEASQVRFNRESARRTTVSANNIFVQKYSCHKPVIGRYFTIQCNSVRRGPPVEYMTATHPWSSHFLHLVSCPRFHSLHIKYYVKRFYFREKKQSSVLQTDFSGSVSVTPPFVCDPPLQQIVLNQAQCSEKKDRDMIQNRVLLSDNKRVLKNNTTSIIFRYHFSYEASNGPSTHIPKQPRRLDCGL